MRAAAAWALRKTGSQAPGAVPALIAALKDEGGGVREAAAEVLGRIGAAAVSQAVPALLAFLKHSDTYGHEAARESLRRLLPHVKDPALREQVQSAIEE